MAKQPNEKTKAKEEGKQKRQKGEKPFFPINEHTATVKMIDRKGWNRVTHEPRVANSMLDIFVTEDGETYKIFYFDLEADSWKTGSCETFDEIIEKHSYDRERG